MLRPTLLALTLAIGTIPSAHGQIIRGAQPYTFNHNPAAISSTPLGNRLPNGIAYPAPIYRGGIPGTTIIQSGVFVPYPYPVFGIGGYYDPGLYLPRGGYLNRESAIFTPPQDNLEATIPSLAPMIHQPRPPQAFNPAPNELPLPQTSDGVARFTLEVPADAEVFLEGQKMGGSGRVRKFVSPTLPNGRDFLYEIEVRWRENGEQKSRTKEISVRAGDSQSINFLNDSANRSND